MAEVRDIRVETLRAYGGLLAGLERLRVVSIGLGQRDDPQQIFESLNATGRPLTESEKLNHFLDLVDGSGFWESADLCFCTVP